MNGPLKNIFSYFVCRQNLDTDCDIATVREVLAKILWVKRLHHVDLHLDEFHVCYRYQSLHVARIIIIIWWNTSCCYCILTCITRFTDPLTRNIPTTSIPCCIRKLMQALKKPGTFCNVGCTAGNVQDESSALSLSVRISDWLDDVVTLLVVPMISWYAWPINCSPFAGRLSQEPNCICKNSTKSDPSESDNKL